MLLVEGRGERGSFIPKEQRGIKKSEVQDQKEPEVGTCAGPGRERNFLMYQHFLDVLQSLVLVPQEAQMHAQLLGLSEIANL